MVLQVDSHKYWQPRYSFTMKSRLDAENLRMVRENATKRIQSLMNGVKRRIKGRPP